MVKLKNIKINNNVAECDIIPEDSQNSGHIQVDLEKNQIIDYSLPLEYEWCISHINHAKEALIEMKKQASLIPTEKTIMWY